MGRVNCITGGGGVAFKIFTGEEPPESQPEGLFVPISGYTKVAITPIALGAGDVAIDEDISNITTRTSTIYATFNNGRIYWVAASLASGTQGTPRAVTFTVDIYNIATDTYSQVVHTTASDYYSDRFSCGIFNNKLIFVGGWYLNSSGTEWVRSNRAGILDLSTGTSQRIADMPSNNFRQSTAIEVGGLVYFYGGEVASDTWLPSFRVYNPATNTWSTIVNTSTTNPYARDGHLLNLNGKIFYLGYGATSASGSLTTAINQSNFLFDVDTQTFTQLTFSVSVSINSAIVQYPVAWEDSFYFIRGSTVANMALCCGHVDTFAMDTVLAASSTITDPMRRFMGSATSTASATRPAVLAAFVNKIINFHRQRETNNNYDASKLVVIGQPSDIGTLVITQRTASPQIVLCDVPVFYLKTGVRSVYFSPSGTLVPVTGVKKRLNGEAWTDL